MAHPGINPTIQLLASMLEVEKIKAQNRAAAQGLAAQLQSLQAHALGSQQSHSAVAAAQAAQHSHAIAAGVPAGLTPHIVPPLHVSPNLGLELPPVLPPSASSSSTSAPVVVEARPVEAPQEPEEPEVPRCHLHRKLNKACKFCKAHNGYVERQNNKTEERKKAAMEKLKVGDAIKITDRDDKFSLPGMATFQSQVLERIQKSNYYLTHISQFELQEVNKLLLACDSCDTEVRDQNSLAMEASSFICAVYRLLTLQLTEGQLQTLMNARSCFIRCAGALFVRLGVHHDRYWELLNHALLDDEEFSPFPGREGDTSTVGQFVEQLLAKDKYCNMTLPRVPTAARKQISKRMVLYGQFRNRYAANLEAIEHYRKKEVQVEVCSMDGEWSKASTVGSTSSGRRCITTRVRFSSGHEEDVSFGMVIMPHRKGDRQAWDVEDLTRVRGRSSQDLMDELLQQQRDAAVASGKDYCRNSGQITMRVGGVPFVAGQKRQQVEKDSDSDEDARAKKKGPNLEHQAKMAAIESKYCARVSSSQGGRSSEFDGPERMRLG